jgi:hypothetical protein
MSTTKTIGFGCGAIVVAALALVTLLVIRLVAFANDLGETYEAFADDFATGSAHCADASPWYAATETQLTTLIDSIDALKTDTSDLAAVRQLAADLETYSAAQTDGAHPVAALTANAAVVVVVVATAASLDEYAAALEAGDLSAKDETALLSDLEALGVALDTQLFSLSLTCGLDLQS